MGKTSLNEHLSKLYRDLKLYTELKFELLKVEVVEKIVEVYSRIITWAIVGLFLSLFLLFVFITASLYLGELWGHTYLGFLATSGVMLLLVFLVLLLRNTMITNPLLKIFLSIFFNLNEYEQTKKKTVKNK